MKLLLQKFTKFKFLARILLIFIAIFSTIGIVNKNILINQFFPQKKEEDPWESLSRYLTPTSFPTLTPKPIPNLIPIDFSYDENSFDARVVQNPKSDLVFVNMNKDILYLNTDGQLTQLNFNGQKITDYDFSPQKKLVAFIAGNEEMDGQDLIIRPKSVFVVDLESNLKREILNVEPRVYQFQGFPSKAGLNRVSFSSDGTKLAITADDRIWLYDFAINQIQILVSNSKQNEYLSASHYLNSLFSPDNKKIFMGRAQWEGSDELLLTINNKTLENTKFGGGHGSGQFVIDWIDNNTLIAYSFESGTGSSFEQYNDYYDSIFTYSLDSKTEIELMKSSDESLASLKYKNGIVYYQVHQGDYTIFKKFSLQDRKIENIFSYDTSDLYLGTDVVVSDDGRHLYFDVSTRGDEQDKHNKITSIAKNIPMIFEIELLKPVILRKIVNNGQFLP